MPVATQCQNHMHALGLIDKPTGATIEQLTQDAKSACDSELAFVTLLDNTKQWFRSMQGIEHLWNTGRDHPFCQKPIIERQVVTNGDSLSTQRQPSPHGTCVSFCTGAPLILTNNVCIGALWLFSNKPIRLSTRQKADLLHIAEKAMEALRFRTYEPVPEQTLELDYSPAPVMYAEHSTSRIFYANRAVGAALNQHPLFLTTMTLHQLFPELDLKKKAAKPNQETLELTDRSNIPDDWRSLTLEWISADDDKFLRLSPQISKSKPLATPVQKRLPIKAKDILLHAYRILLQGHLDFSLRKVATAANITLGHLQHYFPTRDLLLAGMLDWSLDTVAQHQKFFIAPIRDPVDRFVAIAKSAIAHEDVNHGYKLIREFRGSASKDSEITARLRNHYLGARSLGASILMEAAPNMPEQIAHLRASEVFSLINGAHIFDETWKQSATPSIFTDHILTRVRQLTRYDS